MSAHPVALDGDLDTESLEVDDDTKDDDGGEEVHHVGGVGAVKGFTEGAHLVRASEEKVEQVDDSTFELSSWKFGGDGWVLEVGGSVFSGHIRDSVVETHRDPC